jgi:hypothetical protein
VSPERVTIMWSKPEKPDLQSAMFGPSTLLFWPVVVTRLFGRGMKGTVCVLFFLLQ